MKSYYRLVIVVIGSIGILSLIFHEAFIENPSCPICSVRIIRYFTIQSNLFAVIYFWVLFRLKLDEKSKKWKNLIGGVVIYTTITFLIFAIMLEGMYEEKGLNLLGSILLHYLNPMLIIGYLVTYRKEFNFDKKDPIVWIIYPVGYLIFMIINGLISNDYLYPFFQIAEVGVLGLLISIVGLLTLFILLSFLLVKIVSKK